MTPDEQLLTATAHGSHDAFGQLFDTHVEFVFNLADRRTGSRAEADDITAEVFTALWRQRSTIQPRDGSLRPWLAGTAMNLTRRHWRSSDRRRRALARLALQNETFSEDFTERSVEGIDAIERIDRLRDALSELPPEQYTVLTLSVWEQLSHAEIARALGIAVGTVKSRLSRARHALEESLGTNTDVRASTADHHTTVVSGQPTVRSTGSYS